MRSQTIDQLASALTKAQAQFKGAGKDGYNPHFRSHFATLLSVWESCREALTENGLAVTQTLEPFGATSLTELRGVLVSTLMHISGQWVDGNYPIMCAKADPQSFGSAMTYARRYSLMALLGICAVEDDDGEGAREKLPPAVVHRLHQPPTKPVAAAQLIAVAPQVVTPDLSSSFTVGEYPVPYGPDAGKRLKELSPKSLAYYLDELLKLRSDGTFMATNSHMLNAMMALKRVKSIPQLQEALTSKVPG